MTAGNLLSILLANGTPTAGNGSVSSIDTLMGSNATYAGNTILDITASVNAANTNIVAGLVSVNTQVAAVTTALTSINTTSNSIITAVNSANTNIVAGLTSINTTANNIVTSINSANTNIVAGLTSVNTTANSIVTGLISVNTQVAAVTTALTSVNTTANSIVTAVNSANTNIVTGLTSVNTQVAAVNTVLGVKGDAANTFTNTTAISAMSVLKQISSSTQALVSGGITANVAITALEIGNTTVTANVRSASSNPLAGDGAVVVTQRPDDVYPASANITLLDSNTVSTTGQSNSALITGTPNTNSFVAQALNGVSSVRFQITGPWTGTITSEGSIDSGTTYVAIPARIVGTAYTGSSFTANGQFDADTQGLTNFRLRATATLTGNAVVKMVATTSSGLTQVLNPMRIVDNSTGQQATIKVGNTAANVTDSAVVVTMAPAGLAALGAAPMANSVSVTMANNQTAIPFNLSQVNAVAIGLGRVVPANSLPVVEASRIFKTFAQSLTANVVTGAGSGALGDYLDTVWIVPGNTSPGAVTLTDGGLSAFTIFPGGANSVSTLIAFPFALGAISANGAWKVTTGANVSVVITGNFT